MKAIKQLIHRHPVLECCRQEILDAAEMLIGCYSKNGKVLVCGNGGSCADADHIVGELMKGFCHHRPLDAATKASLREAGGELGNQLAEQLQTGLPAINLASHTALSTAFGNDVDPSFLYAQQALGYAQSQDILIGISTSGNAKNVIAAGIAAKAKQAKTIGLTGKTGGLMAEQFDLVIRVPETETFLVQELHLPVYHALCLAVEQYFFRSA